MGTREDILGLENRMYMLERELYVLRRTGIYFQDTFSTDSLNSGYRKFDEGQPDSYEIEGGRLTITASVGQDLWGGGKRGAPLLLYRVPRGDIYGGDFEVECDVSRLPGRINTQVGLFGFKDVENWLFFGFTLHEDQEGSTLPDGNGLIITSTLADACKIPSYVDCASDSARLKIGRAGDWWRFYVKGGLSWIQIGDPVHARFENQEVGMGVKSFLSGGVETKGFFDDFIIRYV